MIQQLFRVAILAFLVSASIALAQGEGILRETEGGGINFVYGDNCERLTFMTTGAIEQLVSSGPNEHSIFCRIDVLQDCADYVAYVIDYGYLLPSSIEAHACRFIPEGTLLDELGPRDTYNF